MTQVARLFNTFKPTNYKLKLQLNKQALSFSGTVVVSGVLAKNEKTLRLHSKDLKIKSAKINGESCVFEINEKLDELIITAPKNALKTIEAEIVFSGKITKAMHGLYPCFTSDKQTILATQFESHHAREVFPCVDEPEAKATFDLTVIADKKDTTLSNMPELRSVNEGELKATTFEQTPIMSTYLLAFVSGPLHYISGKTKNNTEVRVYSSTSHDKKTLKFALQSAIKTTEFFNDYFDTPYPLPKCDHVALPDFSSGAMENWGLITYREVCLIVDPKTTSAQVKEYSALVIAHEISHQWFGNLVTMRWWDDLWLNESFATLMEYIAVDSIYPEWDVMLSFASHEALGAFKRDSLPGVQAVKTDVRHPDEISTLFDPSIVYAKGARLLLMAYTFVGKSAFQKGLKNYFKNHAYGNTEGKDLWTELDKASGKDVSGLMKKWITQPGFPLVTVDQTDATLRIQQVPFFDATNNQTWPTPLTVHPKIDEELLTKKAITLAAPASFVRLNTAGGHFSVRYANPLHQNYLAAQIAKSKLPTTERFLILNDSLMQAKKGVGAITETLTLLTGFKNEESEPVWSVITSVIGEVKRFIDADSPEEKQFKNFVADLVQNQYTRLGVRKKRDESLNDTKLRSIILGLAAYSEKKVFVTELLTEYKKYDSIHKIPADTRTILLDVAIRNGAKSNFTKLLKMYPNEQNAELQQDICSALTSTKDPDHIKQAIKKLKDASYVRPQDVARWYIYLLTNRHAKKATWKWLTSNWKWIEKNFGSDKSYDNYPRYSASAFSTNDWLKEYKAFFGPLKKEPSLTRNIELGTEEIKTRIAWQKRDGKKLVTWLADFS